MRNRVIIGLIALVALCLSSCSTNEPSSRSLRTTTIDFRVPQSAWSFDNVNKWYSYYYQSSQMSEQVYNYGTWTMSHEYNPGTANAYMIALPEFQFMQDGNTYYSQRIDYEVGLGYIRVYVTNSDYTYPENWKPDEMYFHMQIVY
jgi:hypothetical protein